ncbi:MAG TPA: hypothetical protein VIO37_11075 [Candidatus Dormibacteraeota bacterium]|jgi:hypothetical protein
MARKAQRNTATRAGVGKGGKTSNKKTAVKKSREFPLMPIAVAGILLAFAVGIIIYIVVNNKPATPPPPTASGIPCDQLEGSKVHYHAGLQIVYQGTVHPIPADLGIVTDAAGNPTCYYWLHVHAGSPNAIHVESPANQTFTLGQFFAVWTEWNKAQGHPQDEQLDASHVSSIALTADQRLVVYIDLQDGKGPQLYTGDPKAIVLRIHEVITLEITPPEVPAPSFNFGGL